MDTQFLHLNYSLCGECWQESSLPMFASTLLYYEHLLFLERINATDTDHFELPVLLFLNRLHK